MVPYHEIRRDAQVMTAIISGRYPSAPALNAMREHLWEICNRCWKKAGERPTMKTVLEDLKRSIQRKSIHSRTNLVTSSLPMTSSQIHPNPINDQFKLPLPALPHSRVNVPAFPLPIPLSKFPRFECALPSPTVSHLRDNGIAFRPAFLPASPPIPLFPTSSCFPPFGQALEEQYRKLIRPHPQPPPHSDAWPVALLLGLTPQDPGPSPSGPVPFDDNVQRLSEQANGTREDRQRLLPEPLEYVYGDSTLPLATSVAANNADQFIMSADAVENMMMQNSTPIHVKRRNTTAHDLRSQRLRLTEAIFTCPVPECGASFTRRSNLRGKCGMQIFQRTIC